MLPLSTPARIEAKGGAKVFKVMTRQALENSRIPPERCLLWVDEEDAEGCGEFAGLVSPATILGRYGDKIVVDQLRRAGVVAPGDVIRVEAGVSRVYVLYRRGSRSNTLLATERCNSFCLMCSQPPRPHNDHWLVNEMLQTISLVDSDEPQLGISGGEPTLLGDDLAVIIAEAKRLLPNTHLHILSNGRNFTDRGLAAVVAALKHPDLQWGIPLYAADSETHDYIVQARGAWDQTVRGLYNLAAAKASIELRVVVQKENHRRLGELAYFIFRNLTFVDRVAFMGLEPMGFAKANYDKIWVDPAEYAEDLASAVNFLANRGLSPSIYNIPLCTMPADLWSYCAQSISDWKNVYLPACEQCDVRDRCGGSFASISEKWISGSVRPIKAPPAPILGSAF